jgi:hypothetical protein
MGFVGTEDALVAGIVPLLLDKSPLNEAPSVLSFDGVAVLDFLAVETTVGTPRRFPDLRAVPDVVDAVRDAQSIYCTILPRRIRIAQ